MSTTCFTPRERETTMKFTKRFNDLNESRKNVTFKRATPDTFTAFDWELRRLLGMLAHAEVEECIYDERTQLYDIKLSVFSKAGEVFIRLHEWYTLDPQLDLRPQFTAIDEICRLLCHKMAQVEDALDPEVKARV